MPKFTKFTPAERLVASLLRRLEEERAVAEAERALRVLAEKRAANAEARAAQAAAENYIDANTDIPNRKFFNEYLKKIHSLAKKEKFQYSVVMVDIDFFKSVNDQHGHPAGDRILANLAKILRAEHRTEDMVANLHGETIKHTHSSARYGGEEFAIILPNCSLENAQKIADEMRRKVSAYIHDLSDVSTHSGVQSLAKTASFGVATYTPAIDPADKAVVARADAALYHAKQNGRDIVGVSTGPGEFTLVDRQAHLARQETGLANLQRRSSPIRLTAGEKFSR